MGFFRFFYPGIRYVFFKFDPEKIHDRISFLIKISGFINRRKNKKNSGLNIYLGKHELLNPVGMAAGFDKKGDLVNGLHSFGFGLTEVGTFTKRYQAGNEKPRLFRIPEQFALFNRMGFNNPGIQKGLEKLRKARYPFAISIGKSKETPVERAADDYLEILETIEKKKYIEIKNKIVYIAINISSPNTPGLRLLQDEAYIKNLISRCKSASDLPLFVKFSPDFQSLKEFEIVLSAALKAGISGAIVTNTSSDPVVTHIVAEEIRSIGGGLSGQPLKEKSEQYLQSAVKICSSSIPVISSGGIMSREDVWKRLEMGASAVQIYTGFIYQGPSFVQECLEYVSAKLREHGCESLSEYRRKYF